MLSNSPLGSGIFKRIRSRLFRSQKAFVKAQANQHLLVHLVVVVFSVLVSNAIFFRQDILQPRYTNQFFKAFLLEDVFLEYGPSKILKGYLILTLQIAFLIGYFLILDSKEYEHGKQITALARFTSTAIKIRFLLNPIIQFTVFRLLMDPEISQSVQLCIVVILCCVMSTLVFILSIFIVRFNFNPCRTNNSFWAFENRTECIDFCLASLRIIVIATNGITVSFLIVNFLVQLYTLHYDLSNPKLTFEHQAVRTFKNYLNCILHISLLISIIFNSSIGFQAQIILTIVCGFKISLFYWNSTKRLVFPSCQSKNSHLFYDFYFRLIQGKNDNENQSVTSGTATGEYLFKGHLQNCLHVGCFVSATPRESSLKDKIYCEEIITKTLLSKKLETPQNYLLCELWNMELKKVSQIYTPPNIKNISAEMSFILENVYFFLSSTQEMNRNVTQCKIAQAKKFFESLNQLLACYMKLYAQLGKKVCDFWELVGLSHECKERSEDLMQKYHEMLRHKSISLKVLAIYLKLQLQFPHSESFLLQLIEKMTDFQRNLDPIDLSDTYTPTIVISANSGTIENFNLESLSLLRYQKLQLKRQPITKILPYRTSMSDILQIFGSTTSNKKIKVLLEKANGQLLVVILTLKRFIADCKTLIHISFKQEKNLHHKNIFILDENKQKLRSLKENTHYKVPDLKARGLGCVTEISWSKVYGSYKGLQSRKQQEGDLFGNHGKLTIPEYRGLNFIESLENSFDGTHQQLTITIVTNAVEPVRQRVSISRESSLLQNNKSIIEAFSFQYSENSSCRKISRVDSIENFNSAKSINIQQVSSKDLLLTGKKLTIKNIGSRFRNENDEIFENDSFMIGSKLIGKVKTQLSLNQRAQQLTKGIKIYRLIGEDLYNVDLEDKSAYMYEIEAEGQTFEVQKSTEVREGSKSLWILALIIIISMASFIYFYIETAEASQEVSFVSASYSKVIRLEKLFIQVNRITGILRDVRLGNYLNASGNISWTNDLAMCLSEIKHQTQQQSNASQLSDLFGFQTWKMQVGGVEYNGNIEELMDVMLKSVHLLIEEVSESDSLTQLPVRVDNVLRMNIEYIVEIISRQIDRHVATITNKSQTELQSGFSSVFQFLSVLFALVLLVLLGLLCYHSYERLKKQLKFLLMISEEESTDRFANAQKLKQMIGGAGFFELQQIEYTQQRQMLSQAKVEYVQKRKTQKQTQLNWVKTGIKLAVVLLYFIVHLGQIGELSNQVADIAQRSMKMTEMGTAVTEAYSLPIHVISKIALESQLIEKADQYDQTMVKSLNHLSDNLMILQNNRNDHIFDVEIDQEIESILYKNLCTQKPEIKNFFMNPSITCEKAVPGFLIQNPYEIGVINYLRRMNYEIVGNLTETFGFTGTYGSSFAIIFGALATALEQKGTYIIDSHMADFDRKRVVVCLMTILYLIGALYIVWLETSSLKIIKAAANFFNRLSLKSKNDRLQPETTQLEELGSTATVVIKNCKRHQKQKKANSALK